MSGLIKYFDGSMSFLSENMEIIKKCHQNWERIINTYGCELDSEPVYDGKYIKTKLKTNYDKVNTTFTDNEIPKEILALQQFVLIHY